MFYIFALFNLHIKFKAFDSLVYTLEFSEKQYHYFSYYVRKWMGIGRRLLLLFLKHKNYMVRSKKQLPEPWS